MCDSGTLVLIPTQGELGQAGDQLVELCQPNLCGFGPIAAGIETTRLLAAGNYRRVILAGIAGTYDPARLSIGDACSFRQVGCYGVGAGEGMDFQTPGELGYPQATIDGTERFDELELGPLPHGRVQELLLTVTAAASTADQVSCRRCKFPLAVAEDMEGFPVALAAARFGLPTTIIRGISNVAGQRDKKLWQPGKAMVAATQLLLEVLND